MLLSLVPLFLSNALGYIESGRIIERLIGRQLSAIASVEAQHVRDQIDRLLVRLEALTAANPGWGNESSRSESIRPQLIADLERKLDELWEFEAIFLRSPSGEIVARAGSFDRLPDSARERVAQGADVSIEVLEGRTPDGRPIFRVNVPLMGDPGSPPGYLGAIMGPIGLGGVLDIPPHLAGSIESFVLDAEGRPLFVSHPHGMVDYRSPLATARLRSDGTTLERYRDRQGIEVFGIAVPIEATAWRYVAEFPVEQALGPLRLLRRISVIFGTLFALAVVAAAWLVSLKIVAPVRELVEAAEEVGAGRLETRIDPASNDEIGDLGRAFDRMTSSLAEARAREEELHRREIRRAQQLATVGELASGVAHEIKNPVAGIAGGLDLVGRKLGDDESLRPIMDEMSRQVERIDLALRDLLTFARPSEPKLAPADPGEIARRAITLVRPAAEQGSVALRLESEEELAPIEVDSELIRQALVNLVVNAVQATPPKGSVRVTVSQQAGETSFRVSDTGKGIDAERQASIFRPFYTTRHAGTGLGLSISRDIVERHGGEIGIQSTLGAGATFIIRVPDRRAGEEA